MAMTDHGEHIPNAEPEGDAGADQQKSAIWTAIIGPHDQIQDMMTAAKEGSPVFGDPRRLFALTDTFLATLSRHLAAVEDVVYPELRKRVPDGRPVAAEQIHLSRQMELVMRMIEGTFYGDAYAIAVPRVVLWDDIAAQFDEHDTAEKDVVRWLEEAIDQEQQEHLAAAFAKAVEHAPTRPHPYSPHSAVLGRLSHRLWALADRALDTMDGRIIPTQPPKVHGRPDSLLTQYLLGHELEHPREQPSESTEQSGT
jgi:hypothetical protein